MKRNNVDKDKNVCNKLIKIFKEPFGECNSAENTNTSVDFCQQVCTTSRNHWSQTKKPQRWRVTWVETRHLSGLRQGVWDGLIQAPFAYFNTLPPSPL